MACTALDYCTTQYLHYADGKASFLSQSGESKPFSSTPGSPTLIHTQELLWMRDPPSLKAEVAQSAFQDVNSFPQNGVRTLDHLFRDRSALLDFIKACAKQKDLCKGIHLHHDILARGLLSKDVSLGNALLSMYAKCGALARAQAVFDDLSFRDIVTWNALISGYAQHGLGEEALRCFDQMRAQGLFPNTVTFICLLKACGSIGAAERGEKIHAEIDKQGLLGKDILVGTALVDMYAKFGMLAKAQGLFNELYARNIVTWNALISGYAQHGVNDEALICFEQMKDEGFSPDAVTFICVLRACSSLGAVEKGEEIHAEASRQRLLEKHKVLCTALVDMYAKCGALVKARQVLDEYGALNVATWTALISGYAEHGLEDEALRCFGQMQEKGLSPDAITFICVLKACGSIGALEKGEVIHTQVSRQGLLGKDIKVGNALVDMYARCGALAKARGVFDNLPAWNIATWTALIAGYAEHGLGNEALSCFEQMQAQGFSPNVVTYICILKACSGIGAIEKGEEIHAEVGRQGLLGNDIVLGTALVDMYAKCGVLPKAQGVFDKLPTRNVVTWNALITGYALHGPSELALECFSRMRDEGLAPNAATFICTLKACGNIGAVEKGEEIAVEADRAGLLGKDIVVGNAVVDMYAKCGALAKAQAVFDKLPARDVVTWNALIAGYADHGLGDEAFCCYRSMQDEGLSPDPITLTCTLKACGCVGAMERGEEIRAEVGRQGLLKKDTGLGTAVVDMYAKCGELAKAQEVFDELPARGVAVWTALITGYALVGKIKIVFELFMKMIQEGIEPNVVTFVVLLTACSHSGLVEEGQMYFDTMNVIHSIIPTIEHRTCMVDIFSRAGHFDNAISMIENSPPSDCLVLWSALMGACQKWVNVELGRWAFEQVVQFHEAVPTTYVCMSNIYAAAGMLEEAQEVESWG